jgi:hypothetical protein
LRFWTPIFSATPTGRVYFYWGCSNRDPIYCVEMDPATMSPRTEKVALLIGTRACTVSSAPGENCTPEVKRGFQPADRQRPFPKARHDKQSACIPAVTPSPGTEYNT